MKWASSKVTKYCFVEVYFNKSLVTNIVPLSVKKKTLEKRKYFMQVVLPHFIILVALFSTLQNLTYFLITFISHIAVTARLCKLHFAAVFLQGFDLREIIVWHRLISKVWFIKCLKDFIFLNIKAVHWRFFKRNTSPWFIHYFFIKNNIIILNSPCHTHCS